MASHPQHLISKFNEIFGGILLVFGSHYIFTSWINEFLVEEGGGLRGEGELWEEWTDRNVLLSLSSNLGSGGGGGQVAGQLTADALS